LVVLVAAFGAHVSHCLNVAVSGGETVVTGVVGAWDSLADALHTRLRPGTGILRIELDANVGSGVWTVPHQFYDGIYIGESCNIHRHWFCTRTDAQQLTITGLRHAATAAPPVISGGDAARLFWVVGANFTAHNVEFTKGRAVRGGGAVYILSGSRVNFLGMRFTRNTAKYAGAIYMESSARTNIVNMTNCTFRENFVTSTNAEQGSAIGIYGAGTNLVTILDSRFTRNKFSSPGGLGQDVYKQSDSSTLYDVENVYDKLGTVWGLRIVCPNRLDLAICIGTKFSQVSKDSGQCKCLPTVGEDVSFKPLGNAQSYVPAMIIDRNTNDWREDGVVLPSHPNVCVDQLYEGQDTTCNFI
jgi:hypothetical protein